MTANMNEIVENVIRNEFIVKDRKESPKLEQSGIKIVENRIRPLKELLMTMVFEELKKQIREGDSNALLILIAAKERLKHEFPIYTNNLKLTVLAFKPFFLIAAIDLLNQQLTSI